jgi:KaiC/GvpD/RAD55 family RecA-like ATPase
MPLWWNDLQRVEVVTRKDRGIGVLLSVHLKGQGEWYLRVGEWVEGRKITFEAPFPEVNRTCFRLDRTKVGTRLVVEGLYSFKEDSRRHLLKTLEGNLARLKNLLEEYVSLGFKPIDDLLKGGLKRGSTIILTATPSDERDLLLKRFLMVGVEEFWTTLYVANSTTKVEDLLNEYPDRFGIVVATSAESSLNRPNLAVVNGLDNPAYINAALLTLTRNLTHQTHFRRLLLEVIDDILLIHGPKVARRWLMDLLRKARSLGFTTLATLNPIMHQAGAIQAVVDLFDGHFEIVERLSDGHYYNYLRVRRLLNQDYEDREVPLHRRWLRLPADPKVEGTAYRPLDI